MAEIGRYVKAFRLKYLRAFGAWMPDFGAPGREAPAGDPGGGGPELPDDAVVYLHENFRVTGGIFMDEDVIWDRVTPEWKEFCESVLGFAVPYHPAGLEDEAGPPPG